MCGGGEPFSVIKASVSTGIMWPLPGQHSKQSGMRRRVTWVMSRCVKADCLMGCGVMNFEVMHSLKGHSPIDMWVAIIDCVVSDVHQQKRGRKSQ